MISSLTRSSKVVCNARLQRQKGRETRRYKLVIHFFQKEPTRRNGNSNVFPVLRLQCLRQIVDASLPGGNLEHRTNDEPRHFSKEPSRVNTYVDKFTSFFRVVEDFQAVNRANCGYDIRSRRLKSHEIVLSFQKS